MIAQSPEMRGVISKLPAIARARKTTLICGPTGSGKEVIARALHESSSAEGAPYVAVHCGALPEQLVEAELFGHTRGAFTGALAARAGLIRSAAGGTLFLDEVDSLALGTQAKLLRFLETGEFRPVGSDHNDRSDTWVIAASNCNLEDRVQEGAFREDLLYRLDVMRVDLPPLRLRGSDLDLLAAHFLPAAQPAYSLTADAVAALHAHHWPGNVRELKHRIERAALLCPGREIDAALLGLAATHEPRPAASRLSPPSPSSSEVLDRELWGLIDREGLTLAEAVAHCEQVMIQAALRVEADSRTRAAQRLKIHLRTLFKKLQQL